MPRNFAVFLPVEGRTVLVPLDELVGLDRDGDQVVCHLKDGSSLVLGPFESGWRARRLFQDLAVACDRQESDPRGTPTTREEYLQALRENPWTFPYVGAEGGPVPSAWIAEAWELEEVQFSIVQGGMAREIGKGLGFGSDEFLALLSAVLTTPQVVELFLNLRHSNPHREEEFRPAFEHAFARHASALPPPLTRAEVIQLLPGFPG